MAGCTLEYQPEKQQQQWQQKAAQVNYMQTFPSLQAAYPSREAGLYHSLLQQPNMVNMKAVSQLVAVMKEERRKKGQLLVISQTLLLLTMIIVVTCSTGKGGSKCYGDYLGQHKL